MPTISVIIPVYNGEKTIEETIQSVLNQTFSDFELIVVNDDSKDATLEKVATIDDPRLNVVSFENAGVAVSRQRGFSLSTGKFIAFLDADDLWAPEKLAAQYQALQDYPQARVAYCWTDLIDESGKFLRESCHITANGNVYAQLLLSCFVVSGSNPLIDRTAFLEVGGFDVKLAASQDFDLYLRLAACYQYVAVPFPYVLYRVTRGSMSTNFYRLESTSLQVRERAFDCSPEPLSKALLRHSIANFYKSILVRILSESPTRNRGLTAAQFIWKALKHDPGLLQKRVMIKILLKTIATIILPPAQAEFLFSKFKNLFNLNALFGYIYTDPAQLKSLQ
jgi:glycosyltransferase involved in cell wall biosynthesis